MSKKSINQKRALRQQQEREAFNHILNVFLLGLAAECYLFFIYRFHSTGTVSSFLMWDGILRALMWIGGGIGIAASALAIWKRKAPKLSKIAAVTGGCALFIAITGWIMTHFVGTGAIVLCIAVPVITVLGLIFFLYQRDCFVSNVLLSGSLFTVWVCGRGLNSSMSTIVLICAIAVILGLIAVAVVISLIKKNNGILGNMRVFGANCSYAMLIAVCVICALIIAVAIFMPTLTFYLTWALVVLLFAELAYYTVKMM